MQKILFYSLDAAPLFDESIKTAIGGAEIRMFNFAKYLACNGYKVYIIVSELTKETIINEKVSIRSVNYFKKKVPFLLKVKAKLYFLWKYKNKVSYQEFSKNSELFLIRPQHICVFGITGNSHNISKISKKTGSKLDLFIASDEEINFQNEHSKLTKLNTSFSLAQNLLNLADNIFVQNSNQKKILSEVFKVESHLLLNPINLSEKFSGQVQDYILWVGKSSSYKNPILFEQIAGLFKNHKFLMICNKADSDLYEEVNKNLPQNCRLLEHVSADEIELYFNNCKLFINTSEFEGFPNTFLQAAKYGKPIISYKVNPNNFITENNCGTFCNGKTEEVISALTELLNDDKVYALKSQNALLSVKKHDIEKVGKSLMEFF